MSNWCFNKVKISGDKASLEKITVELKNCLENASFFERIYPVPEKLKNNHKSPQPGNRLPFEEWFKPGYEFYDWYDWCVVNWGTKWDVEIMEMDVLEDGIHLVFNTSSAPPVEFFQKFSLIYEVTIEMRYLEEARAFVGMTIIKAGEILSSDNRTEVSDENIKYFGFDLEILRGD